jgi:hypothetical protein
MYKFGLSNKNFAQIYLKILRVKKMLLSLPCSHAPVHFFHLPCRQRTVRPYEIAPLPPLIPHCSFFTKRIPFLYQKHFFIISLCHL